MDPRRVAVAGLVVALMAGASGCGSSGGAVTDSAAQSDLAQGMAGAFTPDLVVSPADGSAGVSPTEPVTAVVSSGQLTQVRLSEVDSMDKAAGPDRADGPAGAPGSGGDRPRGAGTPSGTAAVPVGTAGNGRVLAGTLSPEGTRWSSAAPLAPRTSYVLHTVVRSTSGQEATADTRFSTLAPGQQVAATITPATGDTVPGVTPVSVSFSVPIVDRAAVERNLVVTSAPAVSGTTRWRGDRELVWAPTGAWPPGAQVRASLNFFGRRVGPELYGGGDVSSAFRAVGGPRRGLGAAPGGTDAPEVADGPDAAGVPDLATRSGPGHAAGTPGPGGSRRADGAPAGPGVPAARPGGPAVRPGGPPSRSGTSAKPGAPGAPTTRPGGAATRPGSAAARGVSARTAVRPAGT